MAPGLPFSFQAMDLNRPLGDQGIEAASLDAIVGINVRTWPRISKPPCGISAPA
ncbi:MAG: hypothetical protein IPP58_15030 [Holophagaceae bacterium]|uniref:Uncharacterized protein n=1 Tax=Candidatus Geothrix skivensis TaxID=2954439 RepID=A0A9D7SL04_9BACT|nr:hypothetical protein [Candidatus Geothrix skivensis]